MNQDSTKPIIGIFGAGKMGSAVARNTVKAGYRTLVAGSPRATDAAFHLMFTAPGAESATQDQVLAQADILVLAVPFFRHTDLPFDRFGDKIVIDAMNYWNEADGVLEALENDERGTSEIVAANFPSVRLVKTISHFGYHELDEESLPVGTPNRKAMAVLGGDEQAREVIAALVSDIGFDPVVDADLTLGRALAPDQPLFGQLLSANELRRELADAFVAV